MKAVVLATLLTLALGTTASFAIGPQYRISSTGAVFTRSYVNPSMGESYADPSGLIWGDLMRNPDGSLVLTKLPSEAQAACASIGARLPTQAEYAILSNFLTIGDYFQCSGNSRQVRRFDPFQKNSKEDVIPNLSRSASWVSSPDRAGIDYEGLEDYVGCKYVANIGGFTRDAVRCVLDQR